MASDPAELTVPIPLREQVARIERGEVDAIEQIAALFDRIETLNPVLRAFMTSDRAGAMARAEQLERDRRTTGRLSGPLHGLGIAVKDCIDVEGWISTSGSIVRAQHRAHSTASCVRALEQAGAIVLGKTLMDEWAFGGSCENPHFGRTANPWSLGHTTGGSSGGSAAAVGAGLAPFALGTDTGGSVRLPAALCGVVGFKPTLGRIALDGIHPLAPTYDTLGLFAPWVQDIFDGLGVLDPASSGRSASASPLSSSPARAYYPSDLPTVAPEVMSSFERSLDVLSDLGLEVTSIATPWLWEIPPYFRSIVLTELAGIHGGARRADRVHYGRPLRDSVAAGDLVSADAYAAGLAHRDLVRDRFAALMGENDRSVFVTPMTARPADESGVTFADLVTWPDGSQEDYFVVSTRFTLFANVLGAPSISVPDPVQPGQLPTGVQLVSRPDTDIELLRTAQALQERLGPPVLPHLPS